MPTETIVVVICGVHHSPAAEWWDGSGNGPDRCWSQQFTAGVKGQCADWFTIELTPHPGVVVWIPADPYDDNTPSEFVRYEDEGGEEHVMGLAAKTDVDYLGRRVDE